VEPVDGDEYELAIAVRSVVAADDEPPTTAPGCPNCPVARAACTRAAADALAAHATLVSGRWPGAAAGGQPVPVALSAQAAARLAPLAGAVAGAVAGVAELGDAAATSATDGESAELSTVFRVAA